MSTRLLVRVNVKKKPAAVEDGGKSVLGLDEPQEWHWAYFASQVAWRGRYRLFHVQPRYQADAAQIAGQHNLQLVAIAPNIHELRARESGARRGAAVGPRRIAR